MASFVHKAFVYLGLVDDDDYDQYDMAPDASSLQAVTAVPTGEASPASAPSGVRTLAREEQASAVSVVTPRPAVVKPLSAERAAERAAQVHVVAPAEFGDAQQIGDRLKASQPVIVNLQGADRELGRRMIDFCSGVAYALGGSMEKVADQVFLLTPSNVQVSAEERRRLQERGLYRT